MEPDRITAMVKKTDNTPVLVEYLASSLAIFMADRRTAGQRWTKLRVADYITGSDVIEGRVSDTTIGRFLDPSDPQEPSLATIRAVASFLLLHDAIDEETLDGLSEPPAYQLASSIVRYFQPHRTEAYSDFLKTIEGHYVFKRQHGRLFFESRVIVARRSESNAIHVAETAKLYRLGSPDKLRDGLRGRTLFDDHYTRRQLRAASAVLADVVSASGVGIFTNTNAVVLELAEHRGISCVLTANEIAFDTEDNPVSIRFSRNTGWKFIEEGQIDVPRPLTDRSSILDAIRELADIGVYRRQDAREKRDLNFDKRKPKIVEKKDILDFYSFMDLNMSHDLEENEIPSENLDKALVEAMEANDFARFKTLLDAGADPNALNRFSGDPIVFGLAQDGKKPWVEALLNTGRCDLTIRNARGLLPSSGPGEVARTFASFDGGELIAQDFAEVAEILRDEEIRQITEQRRKNGVEPPNPS